MTVSAPFPGAPQPTRPPSRATMAAVLACSSLTVMANATISPSLPGLRDAFAATPGITTLTGLVLTLPSLAVVVSAAAAGLLADRVNRRKLLIAGLLIYGLCGASGTLAAGMMSLLAGRIGLGVGLAIIMTVSTAMIADLVQGPQREKFMGRQSASMAVGGVIFLIVGGALAEWSWRGPFLVYLAALPMIAAALLWLPAGRGVHPVSGPLAPGFSITPFLGVLGLALFGMVVFYLGPVKLPFRLREIGVSSPALTGIVIAFSTIASVPPALMFGRLKAAASPWTIYAACFGAMGAGYAIIGYAGSLPLMFIGMALVGAGMGALMPNHSTLAMGRARASQRGRVAGLLTTSIFGGQFISPQIAGPLTDLFGLPVTFGLFAAALLAMAALMLAVSRIARPAQS